MMAKLTEPLPVHCRAQGCGECDKRKGSVCGDHGAKNVPNSRIITTEIVPIVRIAEPLLCSRDYTCTVRGAKPSVRYICSQLVIEKGNRPGRESFHHSIMYPISHVHLTEKRLEIKAPPF
jgi:hypothetical protein